jgi:hypothetical protein
MTTGDKHDDGEEFILQSADGEETLVGKFSGPSALDALFTDVPTLCEQFLRPKQNQTQNLGNGVFRKALSIHDGDGEEHQRVTGESNHKRIQRLWREEGLRMPQRRHRKRHGTSTQHHTDERRRQNPRTNGAGIHERNQSGQRGVSSLSSNGMGTVIASLLVVGVGRGVLGVVRGACR